MFVAEAQIWEVHVGGQVIRTTSEHPFWAWGKGWAAAKDLQEGDELCGEDSRRIAAAVARVTEEVNRVYNLGVAGYHTYFVGSEDWGFSIWAHNTYNPPTHLNTNGAKSTFGIYEISINGGLYKVGKADMGRITQSSGLPKMSHEQLRKLGEIFGTENVSYTLTSLGTVTTAQAKFAETARLQQIFDQFGFVLIGNWKSFRPRLS